MLPADPGPEKRFWLTGSAPAYPSPSRFELIAAIDGHVSGNALRAVESLARARIAEEDPAMVAAAVTYGTALRCALNRRLASFAERTIGSKNSL